MFERPFAVPNDATVDVSDFVTLLSDGTDSGLVEVQFGIGVTSANGSATGVVGVNGDGGNGLVSNRADADAMQFGLSFMAPGPP